MFARSLKRTPVRVLTIVAAVAVLGVALYASHSWNNYHWARTSNPFTLKLGDNVNSAWQSYLEGASADWHASSVMNTQIVAGGTSPKSCRPTAGRVEVCNASYGNTGWLGIAQIWLSSGHISQGIVKVNDTYYNTTRYNTPAWRASVMCQEIGHTVGLGHNDEDFNTTTGTCMDYSNDPTRNQHPDSHDYAMLEQIYAHLDSTTTVGQSVDASRMPPAMRDMNLESPGQWGRMVSQSRDGGKSVYVQDFGNGHKVVTFVTWTVEARGQRHDSHE